MNPEKFKKGTRARHLAEERAELLAKSKKVLDDFKAAGRETLTFQEKADADARHRRIEEIDRTFAEMKADEELLARLNSYGAPAPYDTDRDRFGVMGYDHDQVKAGLAQALRTKGAYAYTMPLVKEAVTAGSLSLPHVGQDVSEAPPGESVVALRDIFTTQRAESGNVRYYRLGAGAGADVVPEGGEKPELTTDITPVNDELQKIAVRFTYTDELGEDAEFLVAYIGREATRAVLLRENEMILQALEAADGANESTGTKAEAVDVLAGAIGAAQATNGLTPNRIIANPLDIAEIRTLKASGSGEYAIDPLTTAPAAVHGVPLVPTPAVDPGRMYLTTPGLGVFYTRGGLRVETGFAAGDWEHNRVTTRVEERVLPAVIRASLLTRITLTSE